MADDSTKTYVFGQDSSFGMLGMLAPLLQQRGIDPSVLACMKNNNGFGEGGWFMWIILLLVIFGYGGGRLGNNGANQTEWLASQLSNTNGRDLLMQLGNNNSDAIRQLASTLNCDINTVQTALNSISNAVGMNGQQIINSIQMGNNQLASQLAQCCCDNKLLATQQGYENRIAMQEQSCMLGGKIDNSANVISAQIAAQTNFLNDKFCDLEKREMQSKIDSLREERSTLIGNISNAQQTAAIQQYVANIVAPIAADVNAIKAAQPPTVAVPYPQLTAVPTVYAAGLYPYNNQGLWA